MGFSNDTKERLAELVKCGALSQEQADQMTKEATPDASAAGITFKVGLGGKNQTPGLSAYGMGRYPVTLGANQWRRLRAAIEDIEKVIVDNQFNDYVLPEEDCTGYDVKRREDLLKGMDAKPESFEDLGSDDEGNHVVRVHLSD